jgi:hypothetical protein
VAHLSDEEILIRALGEIGRAAALGGGLGARLAAKFLPTHEHTEVTRVGMDVHSAFRHVESIVSRLGSRRPDVRSGSTYPALRFVFQASAFSNPAVVCVEVLESGEKHADVIVIARAKEGLIRQHTARRSAQHVSRALTEEARGA